MKAFFALIWFEIRERKALLAAAAVASLLPLLAPLLPGTGSNPAGDVREAVMWVMAICLVPLFALLLGVSFIGRDLSEGRLGFYYAQPLSGPTIWFGKLAAVMGLVWAVQVIVVLPTLALAPDPRAILSANALFDLLTEDWVVAAVYLGAAPAVILVAHTIGVVWRARSAWLVIDFVALMIVVGLGWIALRPFLPFVAPEVGTLGVYSFLVSALLALLIGGAFQVAVGRVDLGRSHRVLSLTVWSILGICTIAMSGWSSWIRSAAIEDLDGYYHLSVGAGEWIAVHGNSDHRLDYHPRFLLNTSDGRSLSIGPSFNWNGRELEFSADGVRVAWLEFSEVDHWPLMYADLDVPDPRPVFSGVVLNRDWNDFALSHDGSRLAVLEERTIAVYAVDSQKQLMATNIDDEFNPLRLRFSDSNTVGLLASSAPEGHSGDLHWHLFQIDISAKSLTQGAEVETPWMWWRRSFDGHADHRLAWIEKSDGHHLVILKPESSEIAMDLGTRLYWSRVRVMDDGRIVIIRNREADDHHLEVYSAEGILVHQIDLPAAETIYFGAQVTTDRMVIGLRTVEMGSPQRTERLQTCVANLTSAQIETSLNDYAPVLGFWGVWSSSGSGSVGSVAGHLVRGADGTLNLWDFKTGRIEQVFPVAH